MTKKASPSTCAGKVLSFLLWIRLLASVSSPMIRTGASVSVLFALGNVKGLVKPDLC